MKQVPASLPVLDDRLLPGLGARMLALVLSASESVVVDGWLCVCARKYEDGRRRLCERA